jgi:SulP family sulfate permease
MRQDDMRLGTGSGELAGEAYSEVESPFKPAPVRPLLHRAVPVVEQLRGYKPRVARRDVMAGVTVAALALPSAMAYAELAGLSPVHGLYALLLPTVAYGLLGSSRYLVVGPEGSISALVAASVLTFAAAGSQDAAELAATLALLVGACYGIAILLRLGWVANYFSRPVLIGYIHGVAIVLVAGQLGKLLGLDISASDPVPQLIEAIKDIGEASGTTVIVSAASLAVLLPLRYLAPRFPAPLVVVVAGIAVSAWLSLEQHGVAVVGEIPAGLPSVKMPSVSWSQLADLVPAAVGLFLVSFADEVLTVRSFAKRHGDREIGRAHV